MNWEQAAAGVALATALVTAAKVFFGMDTRITVLERLREMDVESLKQMIKDGFDSVKRELDQIRKKDVE